MKDGRTDCNVMFSLDNFCVKASYIKNKAHNEPWSPRQYIYIDIVCSPACCSPNVSEHNVTKKGKKKRRFFLFTPLVPATPGFGGDWKLCVAVDGDAGQVVSDDLVDCKRRGGKNRSVSNHPLLMGLRCNHLTY